MPKSTLVGHYYDWINTGPTAAPPEPVYAALEGFETKHMLSFNNSKSWRDGAYRGGSNFDLIKEGFGCDPSFNVKSYRGGQWRIPGYIGRYTATVPDLIDSLPDLPDLGGFGPAAINRSKPDKPLFSLLNAVYELQDVPAMLKHRFETSGLANVSNFDLAVEFGWIPLYNDIKNFFASFSKVQKTLAQLVRDQGRPVRRGTHLKDEDIATSTTIDEYDTSLPTDLNPIQLFQFYAGGGHVLLETYKYQRVWFNAQYRYWLPDAGAYPEPALWYQDMIRRLYGFRFTPSNIYKVIPWSWFVDWFANVGDNFANLDTNVVDRLIIDYGYLMRTVEYGTRLTASGQFWTAKDFAQTITASSRKFQVRKQRLGIDSPFGFKDHFDRPLSPFQQEISAALAGQRRRTGSHGG